jgi:GT2 family glycosyltransferase
MTFPKVSIVLVNWHGLRDTVECLESLQKITYPNYEVIVVDNDSGGDEAATIEERFRDYVKLIRNPKNYGFAKGCNIGIRDALARDPQYVLLLNNDTVVTHDFLEQLVQVVESYDRVGIAGGKIYAYENPKVVWFAGGAPIDYLRGKTPSRQSWLDSGIFDETEEVEWVVGTFMLISRDVLETVGTLDDRFFFGWEDVDLSVRATKHGFKVLYVPGSVIWHKGFSPGKEKRLSGKPVYYATRGRFLFTERNATKFQFMMSTLYFFATFPKTAWQYSRILHEWNTPLYMLWGFFDFALRRW